MFRPFVYISCRLFTILTLVGLCLVGLLSSTSYGQDKSAFENARPTKSESELRYWLENMVWHHRFSIAEVQQVLGLPEGEVVEQMKRLNISADNRPELDRLKASNPKTDNNTQRIRLMPYPGGRHPRIGFLDGAVHPQRETKLSAFAPWDRDSYVVIDVPEAVWSNLGLTYLAHTHVDTIWSKDGIELEKLEWNRRDDGSYHLQRTLPNKIAFAVTAEAKSDRVDFGMTLTNGTEQKLSDLRIQMCAMLKGMPGFDEQTNDNKIFKPPFAAWRNREGNRWVIFAWEPCNRAWGNAPCPCLHSDAKFPDTDPGMTSTVKGSLWFYEGTDIDKQLQTLQESSWPDIRDSKADLIVPEMKDEEPAAGVRVRKLLGNNSGSNVYYSLYLPRQWSEDQIEKTKFPVLVEWAGNGGYRDVLGDECSGRPEGCSMGYGLCGGDDVIWISLPYLNQAGDELALTWWGDSPTYDPKPTLEYCQNAIAEVCRDFGGDSRCVILCGFSRGALACNYLGLHNDEIAKIWRAFIPFSHYDGVRSWPYPGSDPASAATRLKRLQGRPQFIFSERDTFEATKRYLATMSVANLRFLSTGFRNHNDQWLLRPSAARSEVRLWLKQIINEKPTTR